MPKDNNSNESKLLHAILELRTKMNEKSINQRQYGREIDKLLADVDDDTLKRFDELEQAFDDGDIDRAEYEERLAAIFPPVNPEVLVTNRPDNAYDVFLSYSHVPQYYYKVIYDTTPPEKMIGVIYHRVVIFQECGKIFLRKSSMIPKWQERFY